MASFKNRQSSETNQSVPETESVPETHSYQEKHFQPTLNDPVVENEQYTEYGATVKPDPILNRNDKSTRSDVTESSDQPGEEDFLKKEQMRQQLQGNSDSGTQYSTPDVSSGISSGSTGGSSVYGGSTAAASTVSTAATATATAAATGTVTATVASAAVAATGAVIIAVTLVLPMVVGVPTAIIFEDIVATDSSIYYSIYFEDYEEGMELYVSLHNNFTDRTHTVESESFSFVERDLKPNMEYTLTVYGSMSAILKEQVIKTKPSTDVPTLTVNYCDYVPEKGIVSLSSTISGDTAAWGDYRAVLYAEEKDGTAAGMRQIASVMLESVDTEQEIRFQLEKDASYDATFAIECSGEYGTETLYSAPMTVYGSPFFGFSASFDSSSDILNISSTVYDPDGVRSEYYAIITVTNASDTSQSYTDSRDLSSGGCEFTNVSNGYTFYDIEVRFQCNEGGQFVDIMDRHFTYSSYSSPAFGNVSYSFDHTSSPTGAYSGTLTISYDLVDHYDQYTQLRADLGDKAGSGWAQSLNFDNTLPHELTFDVNEEGCGTVQPLVIWNGDTKLYEGTVSLICNDSRFSVSTVETAENSTEQTVNKANLDLYADYYDADRAYSDIAYTIVQGSKSTGEISFTPSRGGATRLSFDSSGFVNGAAQLNITYRENGTDKALPAIDVNVYVGPTATLGSYSYDESTSTATVNLTITDQFNAWSNLKANLDRQTTTPSGTNSITCNGAPFSNTVTSIVFPLDSSQDGNMLNTPLVFSLWRMGDSDEKLFESADLVILPFSDMDGYSASARDPGTGRGLDFTFDVYDPMGQWSNFNATVTQGTTQLCSSAVTVGSTNVLSFGDHQFVNGPATLVLTCSTASGTETILNEDVEVYFGPTLESNGDPQYSGTSTGGTVSISVTMTRQFNEQGKIRLYYETATPGVLAEVFSNEAVPNDTNTYTYTFSVIGDFLNRTLSMDMVDGSNNHSSSNVLSVTVQYAYISLENPPEYTDPYGANGRGLRLTVYGGGLDGLIIKASVEQGTTVLRSNYTVPTGLEVVIPFDNVTFANGPATLSFSYGNRIPIPFANGDEEMTVDVYYGPVIEGATTAYDASTTTGTVTLTVTDPFSNIVGKNVRLTVTGATGPMDSEMTIGSGSNTVTFTVPLDSPYINADMSVSVVDKSNPEAVSIVCQPYGYVRFKYVGLESWTAVPSGPMEETITLTLAGDGSLYSEYHATIIQEVTGITIMDDHPITFEYSPTSGTYTSTVAMTTVSFGNGPAVLTLTCIDATSGQRVTLINSEAIQVYYGPELTGVEASYNASQRRADVTITLTDVYHEWDGLYGRLTDSRQSTSYVTSRNTVGDSSVLMFAVSDEMLNRDLDFALGTFSQDPNPEWNPIIYWPTELRLSYAGLADYQAEPMDLSQSDPGEVLTLTIDGDASLLTSYHARITQGNASVTVLFDGDIVLTGDAPTFTSNIIFTTPPVENGSATLTLTCTDTSTGSTRILLDGETITVAATSVTGIFATYDSDHQTGRVTFAINDPLNRWSDLTVKMLSADGKVQYLPSTTGTISKISPSADFDVSLNSEFLNTELQLTLYMGGEEVYCSTETVHFAHAKFERFDSEVLEQSLYPNNRGIKGTVVVTDLDGDLDNFTVTITRNNGQTVLYSSADRGDVIQPGISTDMIITAAFDNGEADVTIEWFNNVTQQTERDSTTVYLYNEYEFTITGARGYVDSSTGTVTGEISYSTVNYGEELTLLVQIPSGWSDPVTVVNVGNGTATFVLDDVSCLNTELPVQLHAAINGDQWPGEVINFTYPSVSVTNKDTIDPAGGVRGITFTFAENDSDNRWSSYHAKLLASDGTTVLKEQDLDGTGLFRMTINDEFSNGNGTLIITCTADGVSDTEVYRDTVELYYGPTFTFANGTLITGPGNVSATFTYYAKYDEFGTDAEPKILVAYVPNTGDEMDFDLSTGMLDYSAFVGEGGTYEVEIHERSPDDGQMLDPPIAVTTLELVASAEP